MKLAAYLRVSTDAQAEHGLGLDVQREAIRGWAESNAHRIIQWASDEGVSGSNGLDTRRGLYEALAALQDSSVGGIVVYRLDRLARDLILQETLLQQVSKAGGRVYSTAASEDAYLSPDGAEDDPSRALIRQVLGAVAQYERAMIRLRLRSGKLRKTDRCAHGQARGSRCDACPGKVAEGGFIGGPPPLGYRTEGKALVVDLAEQLTVDRIRALRAQGLSLRQIASVIEGEGHRPKRGGAWHPEQVAAVLRRQR